MFMKSIKYLFFALILLELMHSNADAYLDPGTGSFMFQMLLAAALGAAYTCKIYWQKIRLFFKKIFSKKERNGSDGK